MVFNLKTDICQLWGKKRVKNKFYRLMKWVGTKFIRTQTTPILLVLLFQPGETKKTPTFILVTQNQGNNFSYLRLTGPKVQPL